MRVYATREFSRLSTKFRVDDDRLCDAVARAGRGLIDADLRAGLIKQRIARPGQGRSGGWRALAAFRSSHRCVFLYVFAKNERDNIEDDELAHWHKVAKAYLEMPGDRIEDQIEHDELREVMCDEQD
ncbi:MAG TPA: type II toxin-antitoxin system RelE/ParE family toxin [Hyphomicrobiaceae bacterium]